VGLDTQVLLKDVNAGHALDVQSKKGDTPLILASCWGHVAVAQILIEAGADTTLTTRNGWDAARWAHWFTKKHARSDHHSTSLAHT
jgi:ankyrin repeat protein